jgi:hypothetical protein
MTDTELEDRLAKMLHRRASDISIAPSISLKPARRRSVRRWLAPLAAVAAVLVVGGSVASIRSGNYTMPPGSTPTEGPTGTPPAGPVPPRCTARPPASWQQAIDAGTIPLNRRYNEVISVRPGTSEYLVREVDASLVPSASVGPATLVLYNGRNSQQHIATSAVNSGTELTADGSAAISADRIVYGLSQPGGNTNVMLYDRRTGQEQVLDGVNAVTTAEQLQGSPVLFGGKVYWLEFDAGRNLSTIKSYDLSSGLRATHSLAGRAAGFVYYRTGLALSWAVGDGAPLLTNYLGVPLARPVLAIGGTHFTFDGETLRWWGGDPSYLVYSNHPGSTTIGRQRVAFTGDRAIQTGFSTWPFLSVNQDDIGEILDLRTNVLVDQFYVRKVVAVLGGSVLLEMTAYPKGYPGTGLSLVPLANLPPAPC